MAAWASECVHTFGDELQCASSYDLFLTFRMSRQERSLSLLFKANAQTQGVSSPLPIRLAFYASFNKLPFSHPTLRVCKNLIFLICTLLRLQMLATNGYT